MLNRRTLLKLSAASSLAPLASMLPTALRAEAAFPSKAVTLVIPFPPGGPTDLLGRFAADRLSKVWGHPVVVENRPGASGTMGSAHVLTQPADGYTLLLGNGVAQCTYEITNPSTAPYQTMRDFAPIGVVGLGPQVLIVGAHVPVNTIQEFIAYAKANPGKLNYATSTSSSPQLAPELFKMKTETDMVHIPFTGAAPALQAILSGAVDMYIGAPTTISPAIESGKARALCVLSAKRIDVMPDVPTMVELGYEMVDDTWFALFASANVPAPILDKINSDLTKALDTEETKAQFAKLGFSVLATDRPAFVKYMEEEFETNRMLIKAANIPIQ